MDTPVDRSPRRIPPSSRAWWIFAIVMICLVVVAITLLSAAILWQVADVSQPGAELDVIKTSLAIGAGVGALITLLNAERRQRLSEVMAADARVDANERRVVDLYTKGVEQFGSDVVPICIGGLYALERLAEYTPDLREQVFDVVGARLRLIADHSTVEARIIGRAIRNFMIDHLAFESPYSIHKSYWEVEGIDLSEVHFPDADFAAARVSTAHFAHAEFAGLTRFSSVSVRGADFVGARFLKAAEFENAYFNTVTFRDAYFAGEANFKGAVFGRLADFTNTRFLPPPSFEGVRVRIADDTECVLPAGWVIVPPATPAEAVIQGRPGRWGFIKPTTS